MSTISAGAPGSQLANALAEAKRLVGAASRTACAWRVLGSVALCPSLEHLLEALERLRKSRAWQLRAHLGARMTRYGIPEEAEH